MSQQYLNHHPTVPDALQVGLGHVISFVEKKERRTADATVPLYDEAYDTLCTFSRAASRNPMIFVPGAPPVWMAAKPSPDDLLRVRQEPSRSHRADSMRDYHVPPFFFEPAFSALELARPGSSFDDIEVVVDRDCLVRLFQFFRDGAVRDPAAFRIDAKLVGNTLIISPFDTREARLLGADRGDYHLSLIQRATHAQSGFIDTTQHFRLVRYEFCGKNLVVQHEVDADPSPSRTPRTRGKVAKAHEFYSPARARDQRGGTRVSEGAIRTYVESRGPAGDPYGVFNSLYPCFVAVSSTYGDDAWEANKAMASTFFSRVAVLKEAIHDGQGNFFGVQTREDAERRVRDWLQRDPENELALRNVGQMLDALAITAMHTPNRAVGVLYNPLQNTDLFFHAISAPEPALSNDIVRRFWHNA